MGRKCTAFLVRSTIVVPSSDPRDVGCGHMLSQSSSRSAGHHLIAKARIARSACPSEWKDKGAASVRRLPRRLVTQSRVGPTFFGPVLVEGRPCEAVGLNQSRICPASRMPCRRPGVPACLLLVPGHAAGGRSRDESHAPRGRARARLLPDRAPRREASQHYSHTFIDRVPYYPCAAMRTDSPSVRSRPRLACSITGFYGPAAASFCFSLF